MLPPVLLQPIATLAGNNTLNQRFLALRDERQAMFSGIWRLLNHFFFRCWPWYVCGLASVVLLPGTVVTTEAAYPQLWNNFVITRGPDTIPAALNPYNTYDRFTFSVRNESPVPFDTNLFGLNQFVRMKSADWRVYLEQQLAKNLFQQRLAAIRTVFQRDDRRAEPEPLQSLRRHLGRPGSRVSRQFDYAIPFY